MLTLLTIFFGVILSGGMAAVATSVNSRQERTTHAKETYRLMYLRGGVSGEIPFASPQHAVNAPGLVQVYPHTQTPTPTPTPAALSTARVGAARPLETAPIKGRQSVESPNDEPKVTKSKPTIFKWNYPQGGFSADSPSAEAITTLHRLIDDGETRKTVLSWAVFGSNGGSVYATAKPIIEDALSHAE